jgi:hypothetical protein
MTAPAAVASVLEFAVGLLSLVMAAKCLGARSFLPFQGNAAGTPWDRIEPRVRAVIVALIKASGLGFLTVALLLLAAPLVHSLRPGALALALAPAAALPFTLGLAVVNHRLRHATGARTPWKGAIAASVVLALCFVLALGRGGPA